jgi:hypothetical protein
MNRLLRLASMTSLTRHRSGTKEMNLNVPREQRVEQAVAEHHNTLGDRRLRWKMEERSCAVLSSMEGIEVESRWLEGDGSLAILSESH